MNYKSLWVLQQLYNVIQYIRMLYIIATQCYPAAWLEWTPYLLPCQDHIICATTYIMLHGMWSIGHYNSIIVDVLLL